MRINKEPIFYCQIKIMYIVYVTKQSLLHIMSYTYYCELAGRKLTAPQNTLIKRTLLNLFTFQNVSYKELNNYI